MMKKLLPLLALLLISPVFATVLSVGTGQPYSYINEAIRASASGDTVLVYPGHYNEAVSLINNSITLASLALTTGDDNYILQTIIDGQQTRSGVIARDCLGLTIYGFTIENCIITNEFSSALSLKDSEVVIAHNIIRRNLGTAVDTQSSTCLLRGNTICYNYGPSFYPRGTAGLRCNFGGPGVAGYTYLDPVDLNNIYCNSGSGSNDIYSYSVPPANSPVCLGTFTVTAPDSYYCNLSNLQISNGIYPLTAADLYVSPTGSDDNTGLTPAEAMRTISGAMQRIAGDSTAIRTIHVAGGTYSYATTGEPLPIHLKSGVQLVGDPDNLPVIDAGGSCAFFTEEVNNAGVSNFVTINGGAVKIVTKSRNLKVCNVQGSSNGGVFDFFDARNLFLDNLSATSSQNTGTGYLIKGDCTATNLQAYNCSTSLVVYLTNNDNPVTFCNLLFSGAGITINGYNDGPVQTDNHVKIVNGSFFDINHQGLSANPVIQLVGLKNNVDFYNCLFARNDSLLAVVINPYDTASSLNSCLVAPGQLHVQYTGYEEPSMLYNNLICHEPIIDYPALPVLGSPCIDSGTTEIPGVVMPITDIYGNPRISGNGIDLGAVEYQVTATGDLANSAYPNGLQAYPNPFNPSTTIKFCLAKTGRAELAVYNARGQKVRNLLNGTQTAGNHTVVFDGHDDSGQTLASGLYLYRLSAGGKSITNKMLMLK